MYKKILSVALCLSMALSFTACGEKETTGDEVGLGQSTIAVENNTTEAVETTVQATNSGEIINFTAPVEGEQIAVFDIKDYGQIKIKLFPEQCPKGVENFTELIKQGYYDGITFHRIIKDFMIQGGDPTGTGGGGESIWGKGFEQEIYDGLKHFSGAVSYATASDKLNGSQFFIVTGFESVPEQHFENLGQQYGKSYSADAKKMYAEKGGYPFLDGDYEVFGQVFEGLDVAIKISEVATGQSNKPVEDVVINYAKLEEYKAE